MMKGSGFQEDIIVVNVDISKHKASKYMKRKVNESEKQTNLKSWLEIFNAPFSRNQ